MSQNEEGYGATMLISFLVGGIVGAGLALLFAPYSGRKMRGRIVDIADDVKDYATDYSKKLKQKIS